MNKTLQSNDYLSNYSNLKQLYISQKIGETETSFSIKNQKTSSISNPPKNKIICAERNWFFIVVIWLLFTVDSYKKI